MLLAILYTLYFARAILLPVALAVVLSLLLRPVVRWLSRRRIPESVGATLCLVSLIVVVAFSVFQLIGPAQKWITTLPDQMQTIGTKLKGVTTHFSQITEAKAKIEEIAAGEDSHPLEVQVQQPTLTSNAVLLSTTGSMLASIGLVIVLTYFLLTSGDSLINNVLTTMPTFREKRQVVELIQNVQRGVSSYLFAMAMINVALGICVALAMWALGLPNPALWGLMITFLNFVPYIGSACTGVTIGLVALLTFDSVAYAALAPLVFFTITTIEGQIITPALLGRHMSLNPIMVFLFLTFWGWMWGVGGAVIAVPILAVTRIACDQFERTRPLGTMLSG
ncbi:MAG: AI-2E family transporter [Planctomycetaceae bacterium]|nr:AI-2E family transporter [Planctomycetaceae bacterium]